MTHYFENEKTLVRTSKNMVYEVCSYETFGDSCALRLNLQLIGGRDGIIWFTANSFPEDVQTDMVVQNFFIGGMYDALEANGYTVILELPAELKEVIEAEKNQYPQYHSRIMDVCRKYGYKNCDKCPLYAACMIERDDKETQTEYTERWERAIVEEYKRKFPND